MRVVVVGAGIGGLVLARGLVRAGHEVVVLERDPDPSSTGGYRLHLGAQACRVLAQVLPRDVWTAVQASSAGRAAFRQLTLTDPRLRVLAVEEQDLAEEVLLVGRVPLRTLLAAGLDEVRWGARVGSVRSTTSGARVTLVDGTAVEADLVVGADGPRSVVARALTGAPLVRPIGFGGLAGRTPLDERTRPLLPEVLGAGPLLGFSAAGVVVFLTVHDPVRGTVVGPDAVGSVPPVTEPPALVWGVNAAASTLPPTVQEGDGAALVAAAGRLLSGWHPRVRALVAAADPASVTRYSFYAPDPGADLMPWPAGRLAALGDAVHALPPTGGQGATAAIRGAGHLLARLAEVQAGAATLGTALASYQRDVAGYAPAAVAEALQPLRWAAAVSRPGVRQAATVALPVLAALTDRWHRRAPRPPATTPSPARGDQP